MDQIMQLPAISIRSAMFRDSKIISRGCCDSHRTSDYAMAYSIGTDSSGYLTPASYRAIVSSCETWDARELCEWQCTVMVVNESELYVCPPTACEGSNAVHYLHCFCSQLSANTFHVLVRKMPNNRLSNWLSRTMRIAKEVSSVTEEVTKQEMKPVSTVNRKWCNGNKNRLSGQMLKLRNGRWKI